MANEKKVAREPSFLLALVPIVAMIGFMLYCFLCDRASDMANIS